MIPQHEYSLWSDKNVFEGRPEGHNIEYAITLTTNNFQCYRDIYDTAYRIMSDFQEMEDPPAPPHGMPIPNGNGGPCHADEQHQAHHRDAAPNQRP